MSVRGPGLDAEPHHSGRVPHPGPHGTAVHQRPTERRRHRYRYV